MASERVPLTVIDPDGEREVVLSSPNRVVWPKDGITKAELAEYFQLVSAPFLEANGNRPVSLERFRDGLGSDGFFSKNPPKGTPDYVDSVTVTYNSGRRHPQIVLNRPSAIVWAAQMNTIVFHPGRLSPPTPITRSSCGSTSIPSREPGSPMPFPQHTRCERCSARSVSTRS